MSHASKSKAKGISSSSFLDLKAELSKQEVEFSKAKAAGRSTSIVGGVPRPEKKPTTWARQNKGVKSRASRDVELEEISKPTLESARAVLERKAKIYEKLRKGKTGGLDEKQYESLLVDFDSAPSLSKYYEDEDDEDESMNVATAPLANDPIVEYEDEFGRLRTARRSEVPRELLPSAEDDEDEYVAVHLSVWHPPLGSTEPLTDSHLIGNPVNHFPVYQPSEERLASIAKAEAESFKPLNVHYDASKEVRSKGAGFYQFSGDEETRRAQMEEMKAAREETARTRQEIGAEDVKPGDVEGMREGGSSSSTAQSKAAEKRKREIEERRKMIEAKRRKLDPNFKEAPGNQGTATSAPSPANGSGADSRGPPEKVSNPKPTIVDPFAALDTQQVSVGGQKQTKPKALEADSFLAELERDFIGTQTKPRR
ncbi:hypothetical protein BJ165DRAFT_1342748 [Panaeolus papilionaceus]|nr:hypothetical protein BJ165DRAFT_1342748 [Panaeolus papilionaceus]